MVDVSGFAINIGLGELVIFVVIFILFLVISRKIVKTVMNIFWLSVASAVFPFVMRFAGFDFPADISSIVLFVSLGIGLYAVYMLGCIIYFFLGLIEKSGRFAAYPISIAKKNKDEKMKKSVEKFLKEKEVKEKGQD